MVFKMIPHIDSNIYNLYKSIFQKGTQLKRFQSASRLYCQQNKIIQDEIKSEPNDWMPKVNQPYTISSTVRKTPFDIEKVDYERHVLPESEILKREREFEFTQPSTLPGFFGGLNTMQNINDLGNADLVSNVTKIFNRNDETVTKKSLSDSGTKLNVTLPLKMPKLSSPFPDPVKSMYSDTVSDQEKANQMYEESRVALASNSPLFGNHTAPSIDMKRFPNVQQKMSYMTLVPLKDTAQKKLTQFAALYSKMGACTRFKKEKKSSSDGKIKCATPKNRCLKKMKLKGCPAAANPQMCEKPFPKVICKKTPNPYPSYSEKCHMQTEQSRSECLNCPWNETKNPNFKGRIKRREFHSMAGYTTTSIDNFCLDPEGTKVYNKLEKLGKKSQGGVMTKSKDEGPKKMPYPDECLEIKKDRTKICPKKPIDRKKTYGERLIKKR